MALFARANANASLLTNNCYLLKTSCKDALLRGFTSYTTIFTNPRRLSKCACLVHSITRCNITSNYLKNFVRKSHVTPHNSNYQPFGELLAKRREEANRSIIVQVQSSNSSGELIKYCKQFGNVNGMHHYSLKENMHFYLVEFNEVESAKAALESATYVNFDEVVPVQSPMLWFRNSRSTTGNTKNEINRNEMNHSGISNLQSTVTTNGSQIPSEREITQRLADTETVSEQMILLHEAWKLDEIGIRLRFLTAQQLERSFVGLFPHIAVFPFGSSVNGFGKCGCDLDLVLTLKNDKTEKPSSRLVFHTKSIMGDNKIQSKRLMETIADSMQYFVPGVSNVRRILQARVPIIKYDQSITGLECDLSMTNMAAVYMSELLCLYGEIDWRVRPLVFTIRQWAKSVGLTSASPGRWITNFSITLIVLYYLQHKKILPSLNTLKSLAGTSDIRLTDHLVDCTFLRDVTKMPKKTINFNTENLEDLLQGFFAFYSTFDFPTRAISLREGTSIIKPDFSPLYICNPLEINLNVSKNVSAEETERLILALRNALWMLETTDDNNFRKRGILTLFEQKLDVVSYVSGKRVVNLAALFKLPNDKPPTKSSSKVVNIVDTEDKKITEQTDDVNRNFRMKKGRARRRNWTYGDETKEQRVT